MNLDNIKPFLVVALAIFAAEARGEVVIPFQDEFFNGVVEVGLGSPATTYTLMIDTGSANTWVGASKKYARTSSSKDSGQKVAVGYNGGANFQGNEYSDDLGLAGTTFSQSIGVAIESAGFDDVDGVLGLGPTDLTVGTLNPESNTPIPTVPDNLLSYGIVDSATITIADGHITFGTPLVSISDFIYAHITSTSPANEFWGFDASFSYADSTLVSTTAGIIDFGTLRLMLPSNGYQRFLKSTAAVEDSITGLPVLRSCAFLQPIDLKFGGGSLSIPVGQYRVPAEQNQAIGGDPGKCYLAVGGLETPMGEGPDFILGYNTLKHFAVVLDRDNARVGIGNLAIELELGL